MNLTTDSRSIIVEKESPEITKDTTAPLLDDMIEDDPYQRVTDEDVLAHSRLQITIS